MPYSSAGASTGQKTPGCHQFSVSPAAQATQLYSIAAGLVTRWFSGVRPREIAISSHAR